MAVDVVCSKNSLTLLGGGKLDSTLHAVQLQRINGIVLSSSIVMLVAML